MKKGLITVMALAMLLSLATVGFAHGHRHGGGCGGYYNDGGYCRR